MASAPDRVGGIDPAALAAATLAAAISTIAPAGPYGPVGVMIGATILVLILAYDVDPNRTPWQSLAFAAVCALILLLTLGYPLEIASATDKGARFGALLEERKQDNPYSEVKPYVALLVWAGATLVGYLVDRWRVRGREAKPFMPPADQTPSASTKTTKTPWNSLEITKLFASMLVPLTIGCATLLLNHSIKEAAARKERIALAADFWQTYSRYGADLQEQAMRRPDFHRTPDATFVSEFAKVQNAFSPLRLRLTVQAREIFRDRPTRFVAKALDEFHRKEMEAVDCLVRRWDTSCAAEVQAATGCISLSIEAVYALANDPSISDHRLTEVLSDVHTQVSNQCFTTDDSIGKLFKDASTPP